LAAVALLLVVATGAALTLGLRRRAQRIADQRRHAEEQQLAQIPPPTFPAAVPLEDEVRQHLETARRLLDDRQVNAASIEVDRVLELDASNADAVQLRDQIHSTLNPPAEPAPAAIAATTKSSKPAVPLPAGPAPVDPRTKALQERFDRGQQAYTSGNYQEAVKIFEALLRDEPSYAGVGSILEQARIKLRDGIQDLLTAARKAEDADDLMSSQKSLVDAQRLGAAVVDDLNRLRGKMQKEGIDAFNQAKTFYAYKQFDKARPLYQRASQFLADDDPNRKIAKDRLDAMRSK